MQHDRDQLGGRGPERHDHLDEARDHASRAAEHAGDAAHHTKEAMEAGAAGTVERARDAARTVGERTAEGARTAGEMARNAARSTAEGATHAASTAAGAVRSTVGEMADRIAERAGGWWNQAKDALPDLPDSEREAYRRRLEAAATAEREEELALAAFTLGYLAAQNPDYRGRGYADVEPDLRHGYAGAGDAATCATFIEYGYERGASAL